MKRFRLMSLLLACALVFNSIPVNAETHFINSEHSLEEHEVITKVTFKDTSTWYVGTSAGATTTKVTVTNTSTAATYLTDTHSAKFWTKQ